MIFGGPPPGWVGAGVGGVVDGVGLWCCYQLRDGVVLVGSGAHWRWVLQGGQAALRFQSSYQGPPCCQGMMWSTAVALVWQMFG